MDIINDGVLWNHIMNMLPKSPDEIDMFLNPFGVMVWTDGSEILVNTEDRADAIAGFLDALGFDSHTGYYDPEQDERDHATDDHTGWWYIDLD